MKSVAKLKKQKIKFCMEKKIFFFPLTKFSEFPAFVVFIS